MQTPQEDILEDSGKGITNMPTFTDAIVDNDGFFDTLEEKLSPILSVHKVEMHTRHELHKLLAQMKKQAFINGVTAWTKEEQKNFFIRVQSEMQQAKSSFRTTIESLIENQVLREIDDNGKKMRLGKYKNLGIHDGNGNLMISDITKYPDFLEKSFISQEITSIVPFDLSLTISENESIQDAKKKLNKYHGKYNALILVDLENRPKGIIKASSLEHGEGKNMLTIKDIPRISEEVVGNYKTSSEDIATQMLEYDINIFPIVDTKTEILIGIVTSKSILQKELRYHSAVDLTGLRLEMILPQAPLSTNHERV